jgi:hypothetical protein
MKIRNPLSFLAGLWRVDRRIEDFTTGITGSFNGTASFTMPQDRLFEAEPEELIYCEVGELQFGHFSGSSQRELKFSRGENNELHVSFADGRAFVDLDLSGGVASCSHVCGSDQYEVSYNVHSPTIIEEQWHVKGPTKNYRAFTILTRELKSL